MVNTCINLRAFSLPITEIACGFFVLFFLVIYTSYLFLSSSLLL